MRHAVHGPTGWKLGPEGGPGGNLCLAQEGNAQHPELPAGGTPAHPPPPEALRLGQSTPPRWETEDSALVEGLRVPSGAEPVVPAAAIHCAR